MSFIDKLRRGLKNEAPVKTEWDSLASEAELAGQIQNIEAGERAKERQRKKLIQILKPDTPDFSKIGGEPGPAGPHDEDIVLAKIAYGRLGDEQFESVLNEIQGPLTDVYGNYDANAGQDALNRMYEDPHQLKILKYAINSNDDFRLMSVDDVGRAISIFQNPMQFERRMENFMTFLAANNPQQKVDEYRGALSELEKTLFGKKYEYSEQIKSLKNDALEIFGAQNAPTANPGNTERLDSNGAEREISHERLVKSESVYQISRTQARNGERANLGEKLPYDASCEDASFIDSENGFYGVFDGAGGHVGGRRASMIAANTMNELVSRQGEPRTPDDLAKMLDEASRRVSNDPSAGYATGTLAKIIDRPNGGKAVMYAQVGDSRLYIIHPGGRAELVTKDEGFENMITNALGHDSEKTCVQFGYREIKSGDKIMLCSDGITGDKGTDLMSEEEVGQTVARVDTAHAAQALVLQARKFDDRTAIVAEV